MKRILNSVWGLMAVVVIVAVDMALPGALRRLPGPILPEALFAALPMANVLGICLALVAADLTTRGEVTLSRVAFLVVGGSVALLFLYVIHLGPEWYIVYINTTVGRWIGYYLTTQQQIAVQRGLPVPPIHTSGVLAIGLSVGAVTVLLLVPALLAGWLTRGRRLLGVSGAGIGSDRRAMAVGLVTLAVAVAIDVAVAPAIRQVSFLSTRIGLIGALPVANVLAAGLAVSVTNLVCRGEVTLSGFSSLLVGGTILLLSIVLVDLAPDLFHAYLDSTVGFWVRPGKTIPEIFLLGPDDLRWAPCLLAFVAVVPPLLVPALLAGWATQGSRLRLLRAPVV